MLLLMHMYMGISSNIIDSIGEVPEGTSISIAQFMLKEAGVGA
jgi:hypothetical protein